MFTLQATPYSPGRVNGTICHGSDCAGRNALVVIKQEDLGQFDGACAGLIVVNALPLSHTLIRFLSHGIPTILVEEAQAARLEAGAELILDGKRGMLLSVDAQETYPAIPNVVPPSLFTPYRSRDGESVMLRSSVSNRFGITRTLSYGASTIGALRSEHLGEKSVMPPPKEYFLTELGMCCEEAEPIPLIVRLPDISAEKLPRWCASITDKLDAQTSRGMGLYDEEPVRSVVLAIAEAAARLTEYHDIRLLFPYVTRPEAFRRWRQTLTQAAPATINIGAMIETPEAALQIKAFIEEADFIALGCNDLMANLAGVERSSPQSRQALSFYTPALFRLLQQLAADAGYRTKEIQVDGQLVRAPGVIAILLGLGYRIFSTEPMFLPELGRSIMQIDIGEAQQLAQQACAAANADAVKKLLNLATE